MTPNNDNISGIINNDLLLSARTEYENESDDNEKNTDQYDNDIVTKTSNAISIELSFKRISKIDNLQSFKKLTTLRLDNNKITKIQNLDTLVHLKWLDLSFNQLSVIEGLDHLVNLTDLSLFHNNITIIRNLEACRENLECLSIGNNKLNTLTGGSEYGTCRYLRRFKKLKVLTLKGNPCVARMLEQEQGPEDYEETVLAYLSSLKYLDYQMVTTEKVSRARERFKEEIRDVEFRESMKESSTTTTKTTSDGVVNSSECRDVPKAESSDDHLPVITRQILDLFQNGMQDDNITRLIKQWDSSDTNLVASTKTSIETLSRDCIDDGLVLRNDKTKLTTHMDQMLEATRSEDTAATIRFMDEFTLRLKNKRLEKRTSGGTTADEKKDDSITSGTIPPLFSGDNQLLSDLDGLHDNLMEKEIKMTQGFEKSMTTFNEEWMSLMQRTMELLEKYFNGVERIVETFFKTVMTTLAAKEGDVGNNGDSDGDSNEERCDNDDNKSSSSSSVVAAASNDETGHKEGEEATTTTTTEKEDDDTVQNSIASWRENNMKKLMDLRETTLARERQEFDEVLTTYRDDEYKRNRDKVMELSMFEKEMKMRITSGGVEV